VTRRIDADMEAARSDQVQRIVDALKARPDLLDSVLKALLDDRDIAVVMPWNDDSQKEPKTWFRRLRTGKGWVAKVTQDPADGRWRPIIAGIQEHDISALTRDGAERQVDDLLRERRKGWVLL